MGRYGDAILIEKEMDKCSWEGRKRWPGTMTVKDHIGDVTSLYVQEKDNKYSTGHKITVSWTYQSCDLKCR